MRFALMIEPQQGLTYDEQLAVARRAEAAGFETLFRSDHYESFPGETGEPTTDAWAVLAGLARDTTRIGLGTLVSPVTFRTPGNLAKVAITVDEMSGGRVEVGVGAGWHDGRAPAPRVPVPGDRRAGRHARGDARDPPRPVGRARRLVVHRRALRDRGRPVPPQAGVAPGPQRRPAAAHRRWRGVAALVPDRRPLRGRVQPVVGEPTGRHAEVRAARRDAAGGGPRPVDHRPLRDGRDADGPDDRRDPRPRVGAPVGVRRGGVGRGVVRAAARPVDPRHARPGARVAGRRSRRPGSSGSCSRTSFPGTSR